MVAVFVKFTAILLLPFLLLAARPPKRRGPLLIGAALATIPLAAGSLALFGAHLPNLQDQSTLLTDFSIPNLVGWMVGLGGGAPGLLRVANVAVVITVALLVRRRRDWLAGRGMVDPGADRQPGVARAVVHHLAAAAGRAGLERQAAPGDLGDDGVPAAGVHAGHRDLPARHRNRPDEQSVGQASTSLQHKLAQ